MDQVAKRLFADRLDRIVPSSTLQIAEKARRLRALGKEVLELSGGQPDFETPLHIVEAAEKALKAGFTKYTSSRGLLELRQAIAKKYEIENGVSYDANHEVLVTPGAKIGIFYAILALLSDGDEVLIPDPCWISYEPMADLARGTFVRVPTSESNSFKVSAAAIEEKLSARTKILILTNPNNPTGAVLEEEDLLNIAKVVEKYDLLVICDEIYEKIIFDNIKFRSFASLKGMKDRTITINGFSKAYAMTGWRLGYVLAPANIMEKIALLQQHSATCAAAFVQKAGVAALNGPQDELVQMIKTYQRRRDVMIEAIKAAPGFSCFEPRGAFFLFLNIKQQAGNSKEFANALIESLGLTSVPGSSFGPAGEGYLRLSFAVADQAVNEFIKKLSSFVGDK